MFPGTIFINICHLNKLKLGPIFYFIQTGKQFTEKQRDIFTIPTDS